MNIKERIQELAASKDLTIKDVEIKTGLSNGSIGKWDKHAPLDRNVIKVAKFFGVTRDYLIDGKEEDNLTENQKLIAYSIDPNVDDEERDEIIKMVEIALKMRKKL